MHNFLKLSATDHELPVLTEKKLSSDAENNTAVVSAGAAKQLMFNIV